MPALPFASARRRIACEIIESGAGMRVDDTECSRLAAQIVQDATKHGVLENIGKIAGMKFVVIVHNRICRYRPRTAGIATLSRRQEYRAISGQLRKDRSLVKTDPDFGQSPAVAGNVDRVTRKSRIGFQESIGDLTGRHGDRLIELAHSPAGSSQRAHAARTRLEIGLRRKARTCAVPVPFVEDQTRTRHDVEHVVDDRAREPRRRHLAVGRETPFVLRPEAVDDKCEWPARTLAIPGSTARPIFRRLAIGRRPRQ